MQPLQAQQYKEDFEEERRDREIAAGQYDDKLFLLQGQCDALVGEKERDLEMFQQEKSTLEERVCDLMQKNTQLQNASEEAKSVSTRVNKRASLLTMCSTVIIFTLFINNTGHPLC